MTRTNSEFITQLSPQFTVAKTQAEALREAIQKQGVPDPATLPKPRISPELIQEAARAKKEWESKPENQAKLAAMKQMSFADLTKALSEIAHDPIFARTVELAAATQRSGVLDGIFAFSVGLSGEVDFGIGVSGTIGYAFDPNNATQMSVFVSVGASIGASVELSAGVELGFWSSPPEQLTGAMVGAQAGADATGFGATFAAFCAASFSLVPPGFTPSLSSWGFTLTLSLGEGGSVALLANYTLVLATEYVPPIAQPDASHMVMLSSIKCVQKQDSSGHDEIVIYIQIDGSGAVYPFPTWSHYSIEEGGTWNCGRSVKLNSKATVKITNGGDELYTWTINMSDFNSTSSKTYSFDYKDGFNEIAYNLTVNKVY